MLINADPSTDSSPATLQQRRGQAQSASADAAASSGVDPSLLRLASAPSSIPDTDFEIGDEHGASNAVDFLRQSMMSQPGHAMGAQANSMSQDAVFRLLQ